MINENGIVAPGNKNSQEETQLDVLQLLGVLWDHIVAIVLVTFIGALIAFCFTFFFISPKYRSGFTAYVNNKSESTARAADSLSSGDTSAQQQLTRTYASIIISRPIIESALKDSGLPYEYNDIYRSITTSVETNTSLINLYVTLDNKEEAKKLADSIAKISPDSLADIVEGSSMKIVSYPVVPNKKFSPSYTKVTLLGALAGFVLCAAFVIIRSVLDSTVKDEKSLEERYGISVIGTIPNFSSATSDHGNYYYYRRSYKKKTDTKAEAPKAEKEAE